MSKTLKLAQELMACPSVTPEDAGCQDILIKRLQQLGFTIEPLNFGKVKNFWARRGTQSPLFVFAGHTDVVPTGPLEQWTSAPFTPTLREGYLYGRGAVDMKGALAAMVTACETFIENYPNHEGSIGFLITGDEEGPAVDGTVKVVQHLQSRQEHIDWCIVGEPSSSTHVGDTLKNGRRGSLSGQLTIWGVQGHIAYPEKADNPIHKAIPALALLTPITSLQISNIHAGTGATNVTPDSIIIDFNIRYAFDVTAEQLQKEIHHLLDSQAFKYTLDWSHSAKPFLSPAESELVEACRTAIREITGLETNLSTSGGTSDARFIAPTGTQVIELGLCNETIHQINECVRVEDLEILSELYLQILENLLKNV